MSVKDRTVVWTARVIGWTLGLGTFGLLAWLIARKLGWWGTVGVFAAVPVMFLIVVLLCELADASWRAKKRIREGKSDG